ncbi:MAG: helix-hairpin-helix domain-containing protein [Bacteroidetes bacterium]|nr:helix-hairpin-helix domain-containing protein [Bacteroidota bacterium]
MKRFFCCVATVLFVAASALPTFAQVGNNDHVLNPNRAGADQLAALPHVSEEFAEQIVDNRMYLDISVLHEFLGASLNEEQLSELYPHLFVPINLNSASREEILLVPGVGERMAHEFEEYRPYTSMVQFRREIGKYVDHDEVARFEQFVFVPINLNEASEEDILSIPGVGDRMLHEFLEYRPYRSIEQFRREIGKYVSEDEVARLERFVTLD